MQRTLLSPSITGHQLRLLIDYMIINTLGTDISLDNVIISNVRHQIIDTHELAYSQCENMREVEAKFEQLQNYPTNSDVPAKPESKAKVLRVQYLT